jgi:hypothetical protein
MASPQPERTASYYNQQPAGVVRSRSRGSSVSSFGRRSSAAASRASSVPAATAAEAETQLGQMAQALALIRGTSIRDGPPPYGGAAFALLRRGTYLIKYGRTGQPHERWFAVRMPYEKGTGRYEPYLTWALHADSAAYNERLHLAHLCEVRPGTTGVPNFERHLVDPTRIRGPYVGSQRSIVPTQFAFTLIFQSPMSVRTVDVLALDDQTFRCWMLVAGYLAAVNAAGAAASGANGYDAEMLAPDTPRSAAQNSATASFVEPAAA